MSPLLARLGGRAGEVSGPLLEPYFLDGDDRGALVIHGFTGTPYDLRTVGQALAAAGLTTHGIRLAGHEGGAARLAVSGWRDWVGSAEQALQALSRRCRQVTVVGLSLGALIALRLARTCPAEVTAVAALAVPLELPPWSAWPLQLVGPLAKRFSWRLPLVPKSLSDIADPAARRRHPRLVESIPVEAALSLWELIQLERAELPQLRTPLLVIHSRRDHTALFSGAELLCRQARPTLLRRLTLERSFHVLGVDVDQEQVATTVRDFALEMMPGTPG